MYILLSDAKKHLNVDEFFHDDDEYIRLLIESAESAVEKHIDKELKDCLKKGVLDKTLRQAILLMVGNWYANREGIAYSTPHQIPQSIEYLISLNRRYSIG